MLNNKVKHRRNQSQLPSAPVKSTRKKKQRPKTATNRKGNEKVEKKGMGHQLINNLVVKSTTKIPQKQIIVEDIEDDGTSQLEDEFFKFGKRNKMFQTSLPQMQEIEEVPDTGSYSQRNTEMRTENKQNMRELSNRHHRHSRLPFEPPQNHRAREVQSHRALHNLSKRSNTKSNRSHDCSQSTVELKGHKSRAKSRGKSRTRANQMLERQVKMIWDCIGDIWSRNRQTEKVEIYQQKRAEQNSYCVEQLMRRSELYERQLLQLKLQCKSERGRL